MAAITICPPGIAQGAEFARPRSRCLKKRNRYESLLITTRRDNARPGDVLTAMSHLLFKPKEMHDARPA